MRGARGLAARSGRWTVSRGRNEGEKWGAGGAGRVCTREKVVWRRKEETVVDSPLLSVPLSVPPPAFLLL
jgi:hypothetical protein